MFERTAARRYPQHTVDETESRECRLLVDICTRRKHGPIASLCDGPALFIAWIDDDDIDIIDRQPYRGLVVINQLGDRDQHEPAVMPRGACRFEILRNGRCISKIDVSLAVGIRRVD